MTARGMKIDDETENPEAEGQLVYMQIVVIYVAFRVYKL